MSINNKWRMLSITTKSRGSPKPCPLCGRRYSTQMVRHIERVLSFMFSKNGRETIQKCSRAITSLVAKGVFRYPEHFISSAFGAAWRESPEEVRESLTCLGVEVISSGISLPEACGVEEEMDVDGNAESSEELGESRASPPSCNTSALLEVETENIPDNSDATAPGTDELHTFVKNGNR